MTASGGPLERPMWTPRRTTGLHREKWEDAWWEHGFGAHGQRKEAGLSHGSARSEAEGTERQ